MQPEETNVLLCRTYPVDCKKGENILREWKQSIVNGHVWKTQRFIMHNVEPYVVPHGQVDRWLFALNEMGNTKWTGEERNFHFLFFSPSCPRRRRYPTAEIGCTVSVLRLAERNPCQDGPLSPRQDSKSPFQSSRWKLTHLSFLFFYFIFLALARKMDGPYHQLVRPTTANVNQFFTLFSFVFFSSYFLAVRCDPVVTLNEATRWIHSIPVPKIGEE